MAYLSVIKMGDELVVGDLVLIENGVYKIDSIENQWASATNIIEDRKGGIRACKHIAVTTLIAPNVEHFNNYSTKEIMINNSITNEEMFRFEVDLDVALDG